MAKKRITIASITASYDRLLEELINRLVKDLITLFDQQVSDVAFKTAKRSLLRNGELPDSVKQIIRDSSSALNQKAQKLIKDGIKKSWKLADDKNEKIKNFATGGRKIPPTASKIFAGPSPKGSKVYTNISAFTNRTTNGMGLSGRVWKIAQKNSTHLEKSVKKNMILGKASKQGRAYRDALMQDLRNSTAIPNPGRGVYADPKRNIERLARTEVNMSYHNANCVRWAGQWFVVGIEVKLSNAHPRYDICDDFKGKYPKDFVFSGWHPQCLCHAVPILASQEDRDKMLDHQLGLRDDPPTITYIDKLPSKTTNWIEKNKDRVKGWSSQPYWREQNPGYMRDLFKNKKAS